MYKLILFTARIVVFSFVALILPVLAFYIGHVKAETLSDPLANQVVIQAPDMTTIYVPRNSIRKGDIITLDNLVTIDMQSEMVSDMIIQDPNQIVGTEARKNLFKGKPISLSDIGSVTIINRNDEVTLVFSKGALSIRTVGTALGSGGSGDRIKVMNSESKKIITGKITQNGEVDVSI